MPTRSASAQWKGGLKGQGTFSGQTGLAGQYNFTSRFEEGTTGSNPEELLGAALAGCYAMALNATLEKEGTPAKRIHAVANVFLGKDDGGFKINRIDLETEGEVEGFDQEKFAEVAERVKHTCIISRALAATDITLKASLVNAQAA